MLLNHGIEFELRESGEKIKKMIPQYVTAKLFSTTSNLEGSRRWSLRSTKAKRKAAGPASLTPSVHERVRS
jgi:hypothetical protein